MPTVVCPSCRKKLRVPDHLAGRKVTCPKCDGVIVVPVELPEPIADTPAPDPSFLEEEPLPMSARLGLVAFSLGTGAILVLCLPVLGGYASIGMSGFGLLVGLRGLHRARSDGGGTLSHSLAAGGAGIWSGFGARAEHYPMAGLGVCLLALVLALLPKLFS
jgi:hypothetical protein